MHMQIFLKSLWSHLRYRVAKSKMEMISSVYKFCRCFQPSYSFSHVIRTSCYVKHIRGNLYRLHSFSTMQITWETWGDCRISVVSPSDLQLKYQPWLSCNHCGRIPQYPLYGGTKILHCIHKVGRKNQQKDMASPMPFVFPAGNRLMALLKQQHHTPWVK